MAALEVELKRLEAEYTMFFAGRLPRLPWETRARVDAMVKRYDRLGLRNTAERFRFGTLQARYVAFCDLWERNLKTRELGHPGARGARAAAVPPPAARQADAPREQGPRVVAVAAVRDPEQEQERLRALYERLSAAREEAGERPVPFERFTQVVRAQVAKLGGGSTEVAFRVAVQDGKVTLSARAVGKDTQS
jgi:hypothetical protein